MITIQDLPSHECSGSSELRSFTIISDAESVNVTVAMDGVTLLEEVFFLYEGKVKIYEIDSLVENHLRALGTSIGVLDIYVSQEDDKINARLQVIYCSRLPFEEGSVFTWLNTNFLTMERYRRLPRGVPMQLHLLLEQGEGRELDIFFTGTVIATGERFDGGYHFTAPTGPMESRGVWSIKVNEEDVYGAARYASGCASNSDFRIDSIEFHSGARYCCYYIDDSINDAEVFSFLNTFNLPEFIAFPGQVKAVTEHSAELAVSSGTRMQYDRKTEKSYKVSWPVATVQDAALIEDFFCSSHIEKHVQTVNAGRGPLALNAYRPVVISESKLEVDKFDTFNSAEFTYMYVDTGIVEDILSMRERIFTKEFNQSFL